MWGSLRICAGSRRAQMRCRRAPCHHAATAASPHSSHQSIRRARPASAVSAHRAVSAHPAWPVSWPLEEQPPDARDTAVASCTLAAASSCARARARAGHKGVPDTRARHQSWRADLLLPLTRAWAHASLAWARACWLTCSATPTSRWEGKRVLAISRSRCARAQRPGPRDLTTSD